MREVAGHGNRERRRPVKTSQASVDAVVRRAVEAQGFDEISRTYWTQGEAVLLEHFFHGSLVRPFIREA